MLILGIESSTSQVGCAIGGHEGVLASAHSSRGKRHAENLTPQIEFVCEQARVELHEISVVAVDIGPGLYTGLRVGVTSAISIAFGLIVLTVMVSSYFLLDRKKGYVRYFILLGFISGSVFTFILSGDLFHKYF